MYHRQQEERHVRKIWSKIDLLSDIQCRPANWFPPDLLIMIRVHILFFSVSYRFYKKASFYDNRAYGGDGGGIDNDGGDLKWD